MNSIGLASSAVGTHNVNVSYSIPFQLSSEKGKVVIYTTSFRGVRHTFEECRYVLDLFHKLRIRVENRDIYMHKFYYKELEERLLQRGGHISVPQVFISGQCIGVS